MKTLKKLGIRNDEEADSEKKKFDSIEEALMRLEHLLG